MELVLLLFAMMETTDSVQVFSDKYLENISDAFKTLYNEEQLSDVTIYCKEGSLKAHKLILAASSPYFCKIFRENKNDFPILILHGTSLNQMKNLIDLLYNGITDVKNNDLEALYTLVREFEIKGVSFGPESSSNNVRLEMNNSNVSPEGSHNRDTRFKGQKRVAVDYVHDENSQNNLPSTSKVEYDETRLPKRANLENNHMEEPLYVKREVTSPVPTECSILSSSDITSISNRTLHMVRPESKLTAWAKKQRTFKCDICPSSFKRSSHLSRHQLVHTGERPYSCDKCDKSFSRHDKLKHHVRKIHEFVPDSMYERIDNDHMDSDIESNNMNYGSPSHNGSENGQKIEHSGPSSPKNSPPLFTISHITSILEDSFVNPPKKGRGRPRKYPPLKNEEITTTRRLRQRKNVNNNEDHLFSQMIDVVEETKERKGLLCQICDKPFTYRGSLKTHMRKIHGMIDKSQENGSNLGNIQASDEKSSPPDDKGENETLITIASVCSLNDTNKEMFEENMEKEYISETNNSEKGVESAENLTYEQLRQLLPEECTLQPIAGVNVSVTTVSDVGKEDCSKIADRKIGDSEEANLPQGPHLFAISSLLQGDALQPIDKIRKISSDFKETQNPKELKIKKYKKRKGGVIRYLRSKKKKSKIAQPAVNRQLGKFLANTSSNIIVGRSSVSNNEDSTNMDNTKSSYKIPQLSSAIEISIIPPSKMDSSTIIPEKEMDGEDLSITVIESSGKRIQQEKNSSDCNLGNKADIILKQKKLLTKGKNRHSQGGNSQISKSTVLTKDSQLTIMSQNTSSIPTKRKRGRPKKQKEFIVTPQLKRGRGRPKTNVYPGRPGIQNYNITNLPYGDLSYLTSQATAREEEEEAAVLMEPLVEINMDQCEPSIDTETHQNLRILVEEDNKEEPSRMTDPIIIEPVVQIAEQKVKKECSNIEDIATEIDISDIETKIGLIGECTISVAN